MKGLRSAAGRVALGLAAAVPAALGLALAFSAWLRPGHVLDWLAVLAFCG
ncbi:hypothetical protein [Caldimonas tepidiphila]|nr:hypothetical protein [Caldimonas tepidiphila]